MLSTLFTLQHLRKLPAVSYLHSEMCSLYHLLGGFADWRHSLYILRQGCTEDLLVTY